jgi:hypothetical protein
VAGTRASWAGSPPADTAYGLTTAIWHNPAADQPLPRSLITRSLTRTATDRNRTCSSMAWARAAIVDRTMTWSGVEQPAGALQHVLAQGAGRLGLTQLGQGEG